MIPLLDLRSQNLALQGAIEEAVLRVTRSGRYILGPEVEAFEHEWARYCGVKHCVGTGNALDSLMMILMASGIEPGDEVIVPSNTYIATWLSVSHIGARPIPVEPDPITFNIDPARISDAITSRTRAIMPVHLYGRCAEMDEIMRIANRHGLLVVGDAAQAHGATHNGRKAGSLAHAEAFSFYPSKNLGALGDAGCVTTDDSALADQIRRLRWYGGIGRVDHSIKGVNSRLDELQAAVLRAKLPHLDSMNAHRGLRAVQYCASFQDLPIKLPIITGSVFHQFVIRAKRRDELMALLAQRGVEAHIHYPIPPHMEEAYSLDGPFDCPIAEQLGREVLSLPIGFEFDQNSVIKAVKQCCELLDD